MKSLTKKLLISILGSLLLLSTACLFTGCKQSVLAKKLDMPLNVNLEINYKKSKSEYVAKWDKVEGAEKYRVTIDSRSTETEETSLDISEFLTPGEYARVAVQALGNGITTGDSDATKAIVRPEIISKILVFPKNADGKSYSVSVYATNTEDLAGRIVFPDYYNDLPVTAIAENCFFDNTAGYYNPATGMNCNTVTSNFRFPKFLEKIGDYAFAYCTIIKDVKLPDTVKEIGNGAFLCCTRLSGINLETVTAIGNNAFNGCKSLKTVTLSNDIEKLDVYSFKDTPLIDDVASDTVFINDKILYSVDNKDVEQFTFTDNIIGIAGGAFSQCEKLAEIVIPENVKILGGYVFYGCTSLKTITLPSELDAVFEAMFYGCTSLKQIDLPKTITEIGDYAFTSCNKIKSFDLPETLTKIGMYAFSTCTKLTELTIPSSVTEIGEGAFQNCYGITSLVIPSGVTEIATNVFYNCSGLKYVIIPTSVKTMNLRAFTNTKEFSFDILYCGTAEEYDKITIEGRGKTTDGSWMTDGAEAHFDLISVYYYSEEEPPVSDKGTHGYFWRYVDGVPTSWDGENFNDDSTSKSDIPYV